ncbi:MAG: hypothetical protein EOP83_34620 [Verrucomicrobiaceae bacterium]|nr:MAG: hypothetical protein EOP83_34620 [Verrucomicrobiaceae bacterium]
MMESEKAPEVEDEPSYVNVIEAAKKPKMIALDESFDEEIAASHGAYNFHWRLGRKHGFATARFRGRGKDMDIKVISVRDTDGETLELPDEQMEAIHEQAVLFIGEE